MLEQIPVLYIQLAVLVVLLGLSGFFSSYETAITSLSKIEVRQLIKEKRKNADIVRKLRDNLNNTIITILIGNNLVNIGASALATIVATQLLGSSGVGIAIGVLTFLVLIFGEITPKAYATQNANKLACGAATVFYLLSRILTPVIWVLSRISNIMIKLIGGRVGEDPIVTKESIKAIAEIGAEEGVLAESEKDIIHRVVAFNSTTAGNIMTPRVQVVAVDINDSISNIKRKVVDSHFSRMPVYEGDKDKILGILLINEFLKDYHPRMDLHEFVRPAHFVTREKPIDELLREMQLQHIHMSIVLDAAGGVSGIVTLEDIMEELVGDIYDETDVNNHILKHINKRTVDMDADVNIKSLDSALKVSLPKEKITGFSSLSEFILNKLGHIPKKGEEIRLNDVVIEVRKANKHRIQVVRVRKK